jgi:cyclic-di-AMP phosphodiesterase PgpH
MSFISFKNIRLFKNPIFVPKHENGNAHAPEEQKLRFGRSVFQSPFFYIVVFALVLGYFIAYAPSKSLPEINPGEIARTDILCPVDLTIEDVEATEARRREAVEAILPVYVFDPNVFLNTEEMIRQFFVEGREWLKTPPDKRDRAQIQKTASDKFGIELPATELASLEKESFGSDLETILLGLIEKYSSQGIILSKDLFIHGEQERGFTFLRNPENEKVVFPRDILEVKEARDRFIAEINKLELPARKKGLLISMSFSFVTPNVSFNKTETAVRQEKTRARVETVFHAIKKGKILIRKGDEATADGLKQIRSINQVLRAKRAWLANFSGTFLLFGLLLATIWFFLKSLLSQRTALKYFLMMGLTMAIGLLIYKVMFFLAELSSQNARFFLFSDLESYKFVFPYQFGVILFAFLTSNTVALIYAILNSLLVGYLFEANYFLMIFSLIGGLAAIYGIKYFRRQKRTSTLRAGFFLVAPLNLFVIVTLHLIGRHTSALDTLAAEVFMGAVGGLLSAAMAFVILPIYENVFHFVTQTKLLELTNSENEIFRQMAMEAPGSYHHSLVVASLAEKAAEAIKIDPLLVKAGALYHDIGKIKMPEYFIENKNKKTDVHKDLTPSMSTLVIINHVKEGVEIAKKEKLPQPIRDIIEQHHGNSLVRYFYQKAKEKYDPEMQKIGEETYRYPGPPPQSKEAALIMLADSVEAASRSLKVHNEDHLKRVITDIFDSNLQDGQLDDCNFSLKDLRTIASSFLATLLMIYQPRVDYPGFDFEMKKRKKPEKSPRTNHDRDPEPPEKIPD